MSSSNRWTAGATVEKVRKTLNLERADSTRRGTFVKRSKQRRRVHIFDPGRFTEPFAEKTSTCRHLHRKFTDHPQVFHT